MPRTARLCSAADFKRVFARPRRSADRYFTVLAVSGRAGSDARIGMAISKKQARRAVDRNRIKRLIRERFRRQRRQLDNLDFVVMVRSAALSTTNARLAASLARHFSTLAGANRGAPQD